MKEIIVALSILFTLILVGVLYSTQGPSNEGETVTIDYIGCMNRFPDQMDILIYQLTEENIG